MRRFPDISLHEGLWSWVYQWDIFSKNSMRSVARQFDMSVLTVNKVLRKRVKLYAYKNEDVQALRMNDRPRMMNFTTDMLRRIEDDAEFLIHIMFSNNAYFQLSGIVNLYNVCILYGTILNTVRHKETPQKLMCGVVDLCCWSFTQIIWYNTFEI